MVLSLIPAPLCTSPFPLIALRIGDVGGPVTALPPTLGPEKPFLLGFLVEESPLIEEGGRQEDSKMTGWVIAARCGLVDGVVG